MNARERMVRANGLTHHVIEWGPEDARETVLCCHGFLDLGWGFVELAERLALEQLRVIAFDFRGHGETEWIGSGGYYHFSDYVLDLHALVPQLVGGAFHLVGHSMGGTVSVLYAATHPERVRTLSLLEGLGPPAEDASNALTRMKRWLQSVDQVRAQTPSALRDVAHAAQRLSVRNPALRPELALFLAEKGTRPHPSGTGLMWRFDPLHKTPGPIGFDRTRFFAFTRAIEAPVLAVYGSRGLSTDDDAERFASLPRARRETIEGAGHMMHWTHPDETARLVLAHIRSV